MPCPPRMCPLERRCRHREFVEDYRTERQRQEDLAEVESVGYATELAEYLESSPLITFRDYLVMTVGR